MKTQKKSKIPYIFFIFFGIIFTVDFFFIYLSNKTWRGVVIQDSYRKGLHYNQTLDEEKKQEELGWKMAISFRNISHKKGVLLITLQDKNLKLITDAEISVELKRPVQDGDDFVKKVEFVGGIYEAKIAFPFKGQWDFLIKAKKGDDIFQATKRFIIHD